MELKKLIITSSSLDINNLALLNLVSSVVDSQYSLLWFSIHLLILSVSRPLREDDNLSLASFILLIRVSSEIFPVRDKKVSLNKLFNNSAFQLFQTPGPTALISATVKIRSSFNLSVVLTILEKSLIVLGSCRSLFCAKSLIFK